MIFVLSLSAPALALAQDGEADPNPDPEPALDGPHDPFGLGVEKLAYSAGLKVVEIFDDNVLLSPDDEESDRITVALIKAKLRYSEEEVGAKANYRGRERLFAKRDEFDGMEHFFDASGAVRVARFRFEAGFDVRSLKEPFDVLQTSQRVDSRFDREYLRAVADFNRLDVEVEAARARFTIDNDLLDRGDYTRLEAGLLAATDVGDKTAAFVELRLHETEYDEPDFGDLSFLRVAAGARGSLTAKIRGEVRIGIARAELDRGALFPSDDFTGLTAVAGITWAADEKHELGADVRREPIESVLTGLAIVDGIRLTYRFRFSERWTAQGMVAWTREQESDGSNDRRGLQLRGGVQWAFGERVYADAGALYRAADADAAALEYENLRISIGVGVEW